MGNKPTYPPGSPREKERLRHEHIKTGCTVMIIICIVFGTVCFGIGYMLGVYG